jgi:FAD/FMN-containing dehydrogenase/SAM-dependent methyltransferase
LGPLVLIFLLGFKRGNLLKNKFGPNPKLASDYFQNGIAEKTSDPESEERIVNDVTRINPIVVSRVETPGTIAELQKIIKNADRPVSIGGGRFSMGGQTASPGSIHIDMRKLNRIMEFSAENKTIKVEAGTRWCDIQQFADQHNLSVKIMQTYANFTVGGALSVNCHGRYIGLGPLILSVRTIDLILANGEMQSVSPAKDPELFFGSIGCYNALGVLAAAEFELVENIAVERVHKKMKSSSYRDFFFNKIRENREVVFHNADLYPPDYKNARAVSWVRTERKPTVKTRLMPLAASYPLERYFIGAFAKSRFGKWRRQYIYDPLLLLKSKVHWRNYEAGYDVAELEPRTRIKKTYVLQEYFVPVNRFDEFATLMSEIFLRHNVNVINVSVRHAFKDSGSMLAWAREEVFAFVIWYRQNTGETEKGKVAVWTRELINAVISVKGAYYLPYQPHARAEQFLQAYPDAKRLMELKSKLDTDFRFRNVIWDNYYQPKETQNMINTNSEFKAVFTPPQPTQWSDEFYKFLQVIFHLYPEDKFHHLIAATSKALNTDEEIYKAVQAGLPKIKPFLSELTLALPALKKQKKEMAGQVLQLLGNKKQIDGYLEIGSTGRYISELRKHIDLSGRIYITNDIEPDNSIADIFERGQIRKLGHFFNLNNYQPISKEQIPDESVDLVTCHIGLHHCPPGLLDGYISSIKRILRKGGIFIMRDHDVKTKEMATFVSLVHTVFNLGLNIPWETDSAEYKQFRSIEEWSKVISGHGFTDSGERILQHMDPSANTLVSFIKQ